MKRLMAAAALVAAMAAGATAREYPDNPDRFPSIGLALDGNSAEGELKYPSAPGLGTQDARWAVARLIFDARLPLSNSFTLDLALGSVGFLQTADQTPSLNSSRFEAGGGYFRIGARYYFNRGAKRRLDDF